MYDTNNKPTNIHTQDHSAEIDKMKMDIGDVRTGVGDTKADIGDAKTTIGELKADIGDTKTGVSDSKADIGDAKTGIGELKADIGDAKTGIGELKVDIGDAKTGVSDSKADIGDAKTDIGELNGPREHLLRMCRQNPLALASALVILALIITAILAPVISPYTEAQQDLTMRLQGPCPSHIWGTDELGRDLFSRVLYGARISLLIGIVPPAISIVIGILLGLLAGYYGGWLDYIIMRLADIMLSFPSLLLTMVIMYTLGRYANSILCIFAALALAGWASVARVIRAQVLSLKEMEYVEAARSIGVKNIWIMVRHILPNCIPSLIVLYTLNVPACILSESTLSFLGIGVQPPSASWGLMVNQSKQFLFSMPWLALAPSLAIMIVVLACNFLGDGLRDVLDPYLQ